METERIAKLEAQVEGIKDDVKDLKSDVKEVHSRITTGNREIMEKIDNMNASISEKMSLNSQRSTEQHEEIQKELRADIKKVTDRVDVLEKWRWMVAGGAIVLGYLISHLEVFSKLFAK